MWEKYRTQKKEEFSSITQFTDQSTTCLLGLQHVAHNIYIILMEAKVCDLETYIIKIFSTRNYMDI